MKRFSVVLTQNSTACSKMGETRNTISRLCRTNVKHNFVQRCPWQKS